MKAITKLIIKVKIGRILKAKIILKDSVITFLYLDVIILFFNQIIF